MANQYRTWVTGEVVTQPNVQNYLQDQVVIVCDAPADYPSSPKEGMVVYDKSFQQYLGYDGSAWRRMMWLGAPPSYTPTLNQGVNLTKTVNEATYVFHGTTIEAWVSLTATSSGTINTTLNVTLPVASSNWAGATIGTGVLVDASASSIYTLGAQLLDSGRVSFRTNTAGTGVGSWGVDPGVAMTTGDTLRFHISYTYY